MPEFKVRFQPSADLVVKVVADDYEAAIEQAYEMRPQICANCSGWHKPYWLDVVMEDIEPYEVEDSEGNTVWSDKPEGVQP